MASDPNLARQIQNAENMRRAAQRSIDALKDQNRALDRQVSAAAKLPNGSRTQSQLRDQIRQNQRQIDRHHQDIRTFDRQIADLKRMQR